MALAIIVYLMTKSPLLAALLPCLHAGWPWLRTACELLHADPNICRSVICFLFYTAAAFLRTAVSGVAWLFCFGVVQGLQGKNGPPNPTEFATIAVVMAMGLAFCTLLGLAATVAAWVKGERVWLNLKIRRMWANGWPASKLLDQQYTGGNWVGLIILISVSTPLIILALALLAIGDALDRKHPGSWCGLVAFIQVWFTCFVVAPVAYFFFSRRVEAKVPTDCWPVELFEEKAESEAGPTIFIS